ncbi:MAG: carbohydrate ABC transporter permease [Limnochordia bacterium]|nr:carbohydrate ABC transporter permease [Bacillota bacterium]NLL08383.1 carbohydrate ABC transporter permease [Bacillota bacterium]
MWRYRLSHFTKRFFLYAVLIAGALIMIAPFVWMLSSSLKAPHEISLKYIKWLPETPQWQNYKIAWEAAPFSTYFRNSFFIAAVCMLIEVVFSSLAAYAFAKMNFFGKNVLFVLFLGTMMIPGEVMLIPNYITMVNFGWIDTYYALIIPWTVSVFSIFLLRQFFMSIPHELFEAALLDGCGKFKYLITVMLPLSKPALATVMLFKFIGSWNAFLWVLIMTNTPSMRTIPVGLTYFVSDVGAQYNYLMAASTFAMAPILILFLLLQKQFIQGIARTGLKG